MENITNNNNPCSFLIEARELCELGGRKNREKALTLLKLAQFPPSQNMADWAAHLDIQINWYMSAHSIPSNDEIIDMAHALEMLSKDPALSQLYRDRTVKFWDAAAVGFREKTWIISAEVLKANNMEDGNLEETLRIWREYIPSAAFTKLIEDAKENARLVDCAQYVYDREEYEWIKIKPYAPEHVVLLLPKEAFIASANGQIHYAFVGNTTDILQIIKEEQETPKAIPAEETHSIACKNENREIGLTEVLSKPIALAKEILKYNFSMTEIDRILSETDAFSAYKGPFSSGQKANYIFSDTIKVNFYEAAKQLDGTYLITYNASYFEKYKMGVYLRVHTSALKKFLKYHRVPDNQKIKIKGNLDLFISGAMFFGTGLEENTSFANLVATITVIDL